MLCMPLMIYLSINFLTIVQKGKFICIYLEISANNSIEITTAALLTESVG